MASTSGAVRAGRAFVEFFTDNAAFDRGLKSMQLRLTAFGTGVTGLGKGLLHAFTANPLIAMTGAALGLGGAYHLLASSVEGAAQHETFELQFQTLLGSADAAHERLEELSTFAAKTPFELPEVVNASRVLEIFTHGALSTGQGLTMVGDAAAGTGQSFERVAFWTGQIFDRIKSGRPMGQALMSMQRMGIIGGETRNEIEALAKAGKGDEAWARFSAAMGKFGGGMERLSQTSAGLFSTLKDSSHLMLVAFGTPLLDPLKELMRGGISFFDDLAKGARAAGQTVASGLTVAIDAFRAGELSTVLGLSMKVAFGESINFLAGALKSALLIIPSVFFAVFSQEGMTAIGAGFIGVALLFISAIIDGLGDVLGFLAAGIQVAIEKAIDILPDWIKPEGFKASTFAEAQEMQKGSFGVKAVAKGFADRAEANLGEASSALGVILDKVGTDFTSIAGTMESSSLIDTSAWKKELASRLRPDERIDWAEVMQERMIDQFLAQSPDAAAGGLSGLLGQGYGTFSAAVAGRFGASTAMDKVAKNTERTADAVESIESNMEEGFSITE